ncbi:MAG: hypothetical protein CME62_07875 [Halobacteriovoraceae bacterium]|nr:hypothetical protein [Halobacteriovoraceae bacterium]|tara:strand:- start:3080 stop:3718 length:639 start_codon:yes stop_codon:yes gene_type:complete
MKYLLILTLILTSFSLYAQKSYISGIQKVTFRSGPGKTNKIIQMIETDSPVTILEAGEEWTKVKDSSGQEGYVLNRFLSKDVPYNLRYNWLKGRYDKLEEKNKELQEALNSVRSELKETSQTLDQTKSTLDQTSSSFEELKTGSQDYLNLKKKYDQAVEKLNSQNDIVTVLKSKASTTKMLWMIAGGGIFFFGWLIGLISRKKKKYQNSIRL